MKKNISEITFPHNNKFKKELKLNKERQNSDLNNTSLNQSQIQSLILQDKDKEKKFKYLSQKVQIPTIYYERVEYVKQLFNNEDLGYIIAYAPPSKSTTTKELGKYFKKKIKKYRRNR